MIKKRFIILIIAVIFSATSLFLSCLVALAAEKKTEDTLIYKLTAYENNVALYKNDELITVYDEIVLNSLPVYDREVFKKGMIVEDITKIDEILQDYE